MTFSSELERMVTRDDVENRAEHQPTRRTMLKVAVAAVGAGALASLLLCVNGGSEELGSLPFDVWRKIRDALRASPDHRIAHAERLIAGKDALAMFAYVRDHIATAPSGKDGFTGYNESDVRWGAAATLRGGMGTPREKAELLRDMLTRAGIESEVVSVFAPDQVANLPALRRRPEPLEFQPAINATRLRELAEALGVDPQPLPAIDPSHAEADAFAARVEGLLPADVKARWPSAYDASESFRPNVAAVALPADGGKMLMVPLPGQEPRPELPGDRVSASKMGALLPVEVTLAAATTRAPKEKFELVKGTYTADQLVGRQLFIETLPAALPENWATLRFGDVHAFYPMMVLQDPQAEGRAARVSHVIGKPITAEGETIDIAADGTIQIGDEMAVSGKPSGAAAAVVKLSISVGSASYRRINVGIDAIDRDGKPVEGLTTGDFAVTDDAETVRHMLTVDRVAPTVSVLIDQSLSMPSEYRGDKMVELYDELEAELRKVSPHARVLRRPTDSALWTNLVAASIDAPDLIVYVTDGDVTDKADARMLSLLGAGPKALIIGVRDRAAENLRAMAKATAGRVSFVTTPAETRAAIAEMLSSLPIPMYRLRYRAPHNQPGEHTAVVTVPAASAKATSTYVVDGEALRPPPQLVGLYLTVKVGPTTITRTLAGHDGRIPSHPYSDAALADVRAALFGTAVLSFEAGAPTTSMWLDDLITARLSIEPVRRALEDNRPDIARTALFDNLRFLPVDLCQVNMLDLARTGDAELLYPTGLRVALYCERADSSTGNVATTIDVLSTADLRSAKKAAADRCHATLRRTASLAVVETARFSTDTLSTLADRKLIVHGLPSYKYGNIDRLHKVRWGEQLRNWGYHWFVRDETGESLSHLRVSKITGEMAAVLPDGSGGGRRVAKPVRAASDLSTMVNQLATGLTSVGQVVALGAIEDPAKMMSEHAAATNVATQLIDSATLSNRGELHELACEVTRRLIFGPIASELSERSTLDEILALLAARSPHHCPE